MTQSEDLGVINGQKVVAVELAKLATPNNGAPSPTTGVEECLLEDGTVTHRCAHWRDASKPCEYVNVNPISVRSHLRHHGKTAELNRTKRELEALKKRAEEIKRNRQNGVKKATETKKRRAAEAPTTTPTTSNVILGSDPRAQIIEALMEVVAVINDTTDDFVIIHNALSAHEVSLRRAQASVDAQLSKIAELMITDPKLIELANALKNYTK
jgi:hypothetical protein